MRFFQVALACILVASPSGAAFTQGEHLARETGEKAPSPRLSDSQIKKLLIEESIAAYEGSCPCPYSRARNGSRCGRRSAYNREGGAAPLCFPQDVTAEMVQEYRDTHP